jgi:hypothetical protein
MKLYVCLDALKNVTFAPRPGGHPCGNALAALKEAGHQPEVVAAGGLGIPPLNRTKGRAEVEKVSGQRVVPVLVTDSGEVITESKRIVEWARAHPAALA